VGAGGRTGPGDTDALAVVSEAIDLLDSGTARVAEVDPATDEVVVHQWLKQAILLLFRLRRWRPSRWARSSSPTSCR
jgi:tetrahydrodipicolinate N-succinyltransferase